MAAATVPRDAQDEVGIFRIATGAGVGFAAALLAIVFPISFLLIATYDPTGILSLDQTAFVDAIGLLILAGALLFLFSLFIYRRGFSHLRKVDSRFTLASILCLIGSIGFLLVLIAAAFLIGSANSLLSCVNGAPTHAFTCLKSSEPFGAYTGLVGFWLGWLGGVGIVLGLFAASSRFHTRSVGFGALLYMILLVVLIGPFIALVVSFPGSEFLLGLVPFLSVLAPYFVFHGARPVATA